MLFLGEGTTGTAGAATGPGPVAGTRRLPPLPEDDSRRLPPLLEDDCEVEVDRELLSAPGAGTTGPTGPAGPPTTAAIPSGPPTGLDAVPETSGPVIESTEAGESDAAMLLGVSTIFGVASGASTSYARDVRQFVEHAGE